MSNEQGPIESPIDGALPGTINGEYPADLMEAPPPAPAFATVGGSNLGDLVRPPPPPPPPPPPLSSYSQTIDGTTAKFRGDTPNGYELPLVAGPKKFAKFFRDMLLPPEHRPSPMYVQQKKLTTHPPLPF
jgi:hypothetical protein